MITHAFVFDSQIPGVNVWSTEAAIVETALFERAITFEIASFDYRSHRRTSTPSGAQYYFKYQNELVACVAV